MALGNASSHSLFLPIFYLFCAKIHILNYRLALQMKASDRIMYLAVPLDTFKSIFQERFIQEAIKVYQIKLLIYDPIHEVIQEWKE